ncbi:MAG: twin-arginine translocase TatA/TatE family subunit [Myxococcales bacterium]|nr:twin-arginine translocase TatA/TatE family subunit [Polyangiaceae bacterium]MDW8249873.1 twin-arginine translocase TatA/TatE family subunit [Myxococcales bacterium]
MFGISFGEAVLLVLLAIIVVGPRDLPGMMRALGRNISKLRRAASELRTQSGIDEILRNEGIHQEIQDLQKLATGRILELGLHEPLLPPGDFPNRPEPEGCASVDPYSTRRVPPRNREYPIGGPDVYNALPEDAYAPVEPSVIQAEALEPTGEPPTSGTKGTGVEGAVARGEVEDESSAA